MKALLLTLLVLTIFVMGCQDKNGLVDPIDNNNQQSLSKTNNFSMLDDLGLDMDISKDDGSISFYSQDLSISGKKGGRITLNQTWWEKGISMTATLNIPAGAFKGTKDFTIKFDYTDLSVSLTPTPFTFDIPVELTLKYYGIDVSGFSKSADFNYLSATGGVESVSYESLEVGSNYITVKGALLEHFSRYGFVK